MRIAALVESEDHVCCRYRLTAFSTRLAAAGHHLNVQLLPRGPFGRLAIGRGLEQADVVVVQRKLLPCWVVRLLRQRVRRLVFDFDDAVWLRDSYAPQGFADPKRQRRFRAIISACDLVIAGNDFLAAEAAKHVSRNCLRVVPTCVEPARFPISMRAAHEGLQLVWVGSSSTLRGLEHFTNVLSAVGRLIPGTRLKLICDRFLTIPGLPVDPCVWREDTEAQEIASAEVGISWIPDDPWSRGKCGLKILQYHAAGLPVVANPVGVHPEMLREGETGFLATTPEEWIDAIARLAADPALRSRLGRAGRQQVEERYSVAAGARAWLAALEHCSSVQHRRKAG